MLSELSIGGSFLTIIFGCIPHCSVSSSQPRLSLCIHLLQLQRFPWSGHCDLLSTFSPNKLTRLFPSLFCTKAFGFLSLLSFESSLTFHAPLKEEVPDLMAVSRNLFFGTTTVASLLCPRQVCCCCPFLGESDPSAALVLSLLAAP